MNVALLRLISIAYLLIPNIIFAVGWYKWQLSVPVSIGLLYLLFLEIKQTKFGDKIIFEWKDYVFLIVFSLLWTIMCGIGGLGYETNDYWAHNARYNDLYQNAWPIYFPQKGRFACYYFGFFLVPALFSKMFNELSISVLFLWTTLGYVLGLSWIYRMIGKSRWLLFIFIFMGWFGHPIAVILSRTTTLNVHSFPFFLDIWSLFLQSSNVPNQVIPILIASGIFLHDSFVKKCFHASFFPITLCFIWAIFPSVVLVLIFALFFFRALVIEKNNLFAPSSLFQLIIPGILFIPNFIYLLSSDSIPISGFIWNFESFPKTILHLSITVWATLLIMYSLTLYLRKFDDFYPLWFINSVYILIIISTCFRMGVMNDWTSRSTITYIILMSVIVLRGISVIMNGHSNNRFKIFSIQALTIIFLLTNHAQFFTYLSRNNYITRKISPELSTSPKIPFDYYTSTYEAVKEHCSELEANQYLGKAKSLYEVYLAK